MIDRDVYLTLRCPRHGTYHGTETARCPVCLFKGEAVSEPRVSEPTETERIADELERRREGDDL